MYGRRSSPFLGALLALVAGGYGIAVRARRVLYRIGILRQKKLLQQVISVGNITLGGTGKTPAVIQIARVLHRSGRRPAVISRGYGRKDESVIIVVSDGDHVLVDTHTGGDEPSLIGAKLKGVPVVVGSDRYLTAQAAHDRFQNDAVILDDGFQHIRLKRDLDIVLIDGSDPFGNGKLFPAGILREPLSALGRAHAVLITKADRSPDLPALKDTIGRWTPSPIFTSVQAPEDLINVVTGETKPLTALRGSSVLAFAGIARPSSFLALLGSLGAIVKTQLTYQDHYQYTKADLAAIFQQAADKRISMIVTTEKDAARLKTLKPDGIWALRIELKVVENEAWEAVLLKNYE